MKKFTLIFAVLFTATFVNAQISLENQMNGDIHFGTGIQVIDQCSAYSGSTRVIGAYYCDVQENVVIIYDAEDYSVVKTIPVPENSFLGLISKGIFTTDNKWAYVLYQQTTEPTGMEWSPYYYSMKIVDEDGIVLADNLTKTLLEGSVAQLLQVNDSYKLAIDNEIANTIDIYSLPGNGETSTNIISPSSPKRSARKITRNGQILVETESNIYTLQGAEVR